MPPGVGAASGAGHHDGANDPVPAEKRSDPAKRVATRRPCDGPGLPLADASPAGRLAVRPDARPGTNQQSADDAIESEPAPPQHHQPGHASGGWSGGEPINENYPSGAIARVLAFTPGPLDFAYVSLGSNDRRAPITMCSRP